MLADDFMVQKLKNKWRAYNNIMKLILQISGVTDGKQQ